MKRKKDMRDEEKQQLRQEQGRSSHSPVDQADRRRRSVNLHGDSGRRTIKIGIDN